ncbi:MAG: sugar transferase [Nitrospinota bacterium]|nr:sugar transferase [Nitrospinota bacterium]
MAKRIFDVIFSIIIITLTSPILILVAIGIMLTSRGPVIYKGNRTGYKGKPFNIYKFRTMVVNAEKIGGGTTGLNDPRVTAVGKYLRKLKFDELPQFFNVIKGEMSVVGPRPELPQYTDLFEGEEKIILDVKPGITDYSSIEFSELHKVVGAHDVDRMFEENVLKKKNALRVKYVREQGFFTDLKIIWMTIAKLMKMLFSR